MLMHEPAVAVATDAPRKDLKTLVEDYEKALILEALQATSGNQRQAAFALGILPTTLHEKLKRLGLWDGSRRVDKALEAEAASPRI
jgi:DNA-binding NtrC family response regulator